MLLGSLLLGLQRARLTTRVTGCKNAAEGVTFEQLLRVIEAIETSTWYEADTPFARHPCRLVDLLDRTFDQAQACLKMEEDSFGWGA